MDLFMINEKLSKMDIDGGEAACYKMDDAKESILDSVAKSNGFFKSQQVGDKDLTFSEKREIASTLLDKNIPLFLERYWKYIKLEDVDFFQPSDSYEVNFYVSEIVKYRNSSINKTSIKNRRYGALKKLVKEGSYFSDEEMKRRNPFLYDQLIGQHLTENEKIAAYREHHKDERFSTFLLDQMDRNIVNCLFEQQKREDEACIVEEDDDDDTEEEEESEVESELEDEPVPKSITPLEKARLRTEFTNVMYESFLSGKDSGFDYSTVDQNAEYDPLEKDLDAEDKYFEEESEEEMNSTFL